MSKEFEIAREFEPQGEAAAIAATAKHLADFWDPRMKRRLFDLVDSEADDLEPEALAAAALLR